MAIRRSPPIFFGDLRSPPIFFGDSEIAELLCLGDPATSRRMTYVGANYLPLTTSWITFPAFGWAAL